MLKLSRAIMVVRAIRVFKELRLMVASLMGCACPTLLWSLLMLLFIIHIFALLFVQSMTTHLQESELTEERRAMILDQFGSVSECMLTLWKASTGGDDWGNAFEVVQTVSDEDGWLFLIFIFFFQGAIFNLMTGIFVEKAIHAAQPTPEEEVTAKLREDAADARQLREKCAKLDATGDGKISFNEFVLYMASDRKFASWFELHGLNIKSAHSFFRMLATVNSEDAIELDAFVSAWHVVAGPGLGARPAPPQF